MRAIKRPEQNPESLILQDFPATTPRAARFLHFSCLLALAILLSAATSLARERIFGYCSEGGITIIVGGNIKAPQKVQGSWPGCQVTVYLTGTLTLAPLWADNNGTVLPQPFLADSATGYFFFYPPNGRYDIQFSGSGISSPFVYADVLAFDPAELGLFNVLDYGAVCDGTTDDTAAFLATAAAATANGTYGELFVPPGVTCLINGHPTFGQTGLTISGYGATISSTNSDYIAISNGIDQTVEGLTFSDEAVSGSNEGVWFALSVQHFTFKDNWIITTHTPTVAGGPIGLLQLTSTANYATLAAAYANDSSMSTGAFNRDVMVTGNHCVANGTILPAYGMVSTAGPAVTWISGSQFVNRLGAEGAGSSFYINNAAYTVSAFNGPTSISLTATAGTQALASFRTTGNLSVTQCIQVAYGKGITVENNYSLGYENAFQYWGGDANSNQSGPNLIQKLSLSNNVADGGILWGSKGEGVTADSNRVGPGYDVCIDFEGSTSVAATNNYAHDCPFGLYTTFYASKNIVFSGNTGEMHNWWHPLIEFAGGSDVARGNQDVSYIGNHLYNLDPTGMSPIYLQSCEYDNIILRGNDFRNAWLDAAFNIIGILVQGNSFIYDQSAPSAFSALEVVRLNQCLTCFTTPPMRAVIQGNQIISNAPQPAGSIAINVGFGDSNHTAYGSAIIADNNTGQGSNPLPIDILSSIGTGSVGPGISILVTGNKTSACAINTNIYPIYLGPPVYSQTGNMNLLTGQGCTSDVTPPGPDLTVVNPADTMGPEMITDGDFSGCPSSCYWSVEAGTGLTINTSSVTYDSSSGTGEIQQIAAWMAIPPVQGATYRMCATFSGASGSPLLFIHGEFAVWNSGNGISIPVTVGAPSCIDVIATNANPSITLYATNTGTFALTRFSLKTLGGRVKAQGTVTGPQVVSTFGGGCTVNELSFSGGWGTGAYTVAAAGTGQTCQWSIQTPVGGQTANPTITDTLTTPLPSAQTVCDMRVVGGTGTPSLLYTSTLSATAPVFTFEGTPSSNMTYYLLRRCGP